MPGFEVGSYLCPCDGGQGDVSVEAGDDLGGDDVGGHHGNPEPNNVSFFPGEARYNRAKYRGP